VPTRRARKRASGSARRPALTAPAHNRQPPLLNTASALRNY
jgi:hypothetical protein